MKLRNIGILVVVLCTALLLISQTNALPSVLVERISVADQTDAQANNTSSRNDINADGRYVVFASYATNLVDGDTNVHKDIFLRDRELGTTKRISVDSVGVQGDNDSDAPVISADGLFVAYQSYATNLVASDTNDKADIFLYNVTTAATTRLSVSSASVEANDHSFDPAISSDGTVVAFQSAATNLVAGDTNAMRDIFTRSGSTTTRVSVDTAEAEADGDSMHPAISKDGRYIAFASMATDLIAADTNNVADVFLRDTTAGTTIRVSEATDGTEANGGSVFPAIDDDGSYIVYESVATNLVASDTNLVRDVFSYQRSTHETNRVSIATDGTQANNASGDGVDEQSVDISADGQYVAYKSRATNLVTGDTNGVVDVFVYHQRESFITSRVSVNGAGQQGNSYSYYPSISSDGQYISYYSYATNLVDADSNGFGDIFVYDRDIATATPTVSPTPTGAPNPATLTLTQNTTSPTEATLATTVGNATVRCEKVTQGGTLTVRVLTSPPGQLQSYLTILRTNFDVTTSGLVCDTITICLPYGDGEVTTANLTEANMHLFHYTSSNWSDVTTYIDTANNRACGRPSSFSPFVIGEYNGLTPTPTPTPVGPTATPTPVPQLPNTGSVKPTIIFLSLVLGSIVGGGILLKRVAY